MSESVTSRVCFLFEHEIRIAAKALRRASELCDEKSGATKEERNAALHDALSTSLSALYHASDDGLALVLTSAKDLWGARSRVSRSSGA